MSVSQLIEELERAGVRLWEDAGKVRFRAPRGVMTGERVAALRQHKAGVLDYLRRDTPEQQLTPDPARRHEPFPLTDVQTAYLLGRKNAFAYGGVGCHAYAELELPELVPARLEGAWRRLIDRHEMLRAVVYPDGYQRVLAKVPDYTVALTDLRGAPAERVDAQLRSVREELSHRIYRTDEWPLFDLRVTRTDACALVHLSIDLLIADFVSIQVLTRELDDLYTDPSASLLARIPLTASFRDYVLAERRMRTGTRYQRDRQYWLERVDDLPGAPELPLREQTGQDDAVGAASGTARFRRWQETLPPDLWSRLRIGAANQGLTASGAVLAAYAEVIGRWSRSPQFTLNLTLQNRLPLHPDVDRMVGDFTSVSLLAVNRGDGATFRDRAHAVHAQLRRDVSHRTFSGVEVMREIARRLGPATDRGSALMPIVFTSAIGGAEQQAAELLGGRAGEGISQTPQVWIDCQVSERGGELSVNWDVRDGVFPDHLIEDAFGAFVALLHELATGEETWNAAVPVSLPEAQRQQRARFNDTAAPLAAADSLLHEGVLAAASRGPQRPAVIHGTRELTYAELVGRAYAATEALVSAGVAPGDPVAVFMDKGWEQVVAVLGVLMRGAAYVPIDSGQPPLRRAAMLTEADVRQVLTQSWLHESAEVPEGFGVIDVDSLGSRDVPPGPARHVTPDDLAYVIYTSGSSGKPKGVMISHRAAMNTIADINSRFDIGPGDRILGLAHLGFDLSVYDIFGVLAAGGCLVLPEADRRGDPSHWADMVTRHSITVWNSVPAHMQMLNHYLDTAPDVTLAALRLGLLSGDWIPTSLPDAVRRRLPGLRLVSLGGATEASIWSIFYPIEQGPADRRSIPYGRPLTNQHFHVLDSRMLPCPDWTTGELYIGGAGLSLGYLGDEAKTAERFVADPWMGERLYRTGDLGRHLPAGVIEFLGREDDQVKIGGHRIELAEVETALAEHPGVTTATAVVWEAHSEQDASSGQRRLAAFVQPGQRSEQDGEHAQTAMRNEALASAATAAAELVVAEVDPGLLAEAGRLLDELALLSMARALREQGLFVSPDASHSAADVLASADVASRHHPLIRRWLHALNREGMLGRDERTGRYHGSLQAEPAAVEQRWQRLETITVQAGYGAELMRYLRVSARHLPELFRDELDPLALLFPRGQVDRAEAAYKDNLLSAYLNQAAIAVLRRLAADQPETKPLRVLEVGAGVGGTSSELIPALDGFPVDYLFTDVSRFFLNEAKELFAAYPWVRYALFDINEDIRAQGMAPNTVDVLVCANVLHNGRHAGELLDRLRELLAPGGWLVFIEATKDNYQLMVSMEFKHGLGAFEDFRRDLGQTFITRTQWLELLERAGAETVVCLPDDEVWSGLGQHVFAARFTSDREPVRPEELTGHLARRLPEAMIPSHMQVVDALPLSANGKVDRKQLLSWLPRDASNPVGTEGSEPLDDLERRIAAVWAEVLGLSGIGRDQDFFALGGDSLLVAQLIGRLRERLPEVGGQQWDALLRRMLVRPTVASLASYLRDLDSRTASNSGSGDEASPLVPMSGGAPRRGVRDTDPVAVLLHDGSGTVAPYRALVRELTGPAGVRMPLVGVAVNDIDPYLALRPDSLIDQLAERYAAQLVREAGSTFHVVGYCMGGLLATATARQLAARGAEVASLSVISSYRPPYAVDDELLIEYLFARVMGVDPARAGFPADEEALGRALRSVLARNPHRLEDGGFAAVGGDPVLDDIARGMKALTARGREERLAAIGRELADLSPERSVGTPERLGPMYAVFRQSLRAAILHPATPWPGDMTLLRHQGHGEFLPGQPADLAGFWNELCGGELRVRDLPGNHFNCLSPDHARHAAQVLAAEVWK